MAAGFAALEPEASQFMTYVFAECRVGRYNDATRLANLGFGDSAVDSGGGYTYFDAQTGNEFSAVLGFTYNFRIDPPDIRMASTSISIGAHRNFTKQLQMRLVTATISSHATADRERCSDASSRVVGVGPQIGYILPLGEMQAYFNVKGYKEFDAAHRPRGWNTWLTISVSPGRIDAAVIHSGRDEIGEKRSSTASTRAG